MNLHIGQDVPRRTKRLDLSQLSDLNISSVRSRNDVLLLKKYLDLVLWSDVDSVTESAELDEFFTKFLKTAQLGVENLLNIQRHLLDISLSLNTEARKLSHEIDSLSLANKQRVRMMIQHVYSATGK